MARRQGQFTETVRVPVIRAGQAPPTSRAARRAMAPPARRVVRERGRTRREDDRILRPFLPLLSAYGVVFSYIIAGRHGALAAVIAISAYTIYQAFRPARVRPPGRSRRPRPSPAADSRRRGVNQKGTGGERL